MQFPIGTPAAIWGIGTLFAGLMTVWTIPILAPIATSVSSVAVLILLGIIALMWVKRR